MSVVLFAASLSRAEPEAHAPTTLTVFAAASLHESFEAIGEQFERSNPGVKVVCSFAGSQQLAAQIRNGAPADVFASADSRNMAKLSDMVDPPTMFATNRLVVVTPPRSTTVTDLRSLVRAKHLVVAADAVPAGKYTRTMLDSASKVFGAGWLNDVLGHVVSQEQDVRSVLAKVQLGEADAGVVYATDARKGGSKVRTVAVPDTMSPVAEYPVSAVRTSGRLAVAREFVRFLLSGMSQSILRDHGFGAPLASRVQSRR
ncbi:MAG: molybdate ABC transporter substrate-binding protein [Fimbriimonadaceae bacterium]|nr:molybdate ABC transporter substrate-binding protein [Fimbriimonadaceae bacterium]